jgi:hypothetical protein
MTLIMSLRGVQRRGNLHPVARAMLDGDCFRPLHLLAMT